MHDLRAMALPQSKNMQNGVAHPDQREYHKENNESDRFPILPSPPSFHLDIPVWENIVFHCVVLA
jgi:hypothetical protein